MNRCKVVVLATIPFNVEPKKKWIIALDATDFIDELADESIIAYSNCLIDLKEKNYAIDVAFECLDIEMAMMLNGILENVCV